MDQAVVIDSSVILKWLNNVSEDHIDQADKLLKTAQSGKVSIFAPELAKYEVGNVLLKGKGLSATQAAEVFELFYKLPITYYEDTEQLCKITFKLASESGITYYDACFMALSIQQNAVLVTDNFAHQGQSKKLRVIDLKDY